MHRALVDAPVDASGDAAPPIGTSALLRLPRRALLTGAGTATLLAVTGCSNPFASAPVTRTVTTEAPPPVDPMLNLIATTRLHMLRLEAAIAKGGELAPRLTWLRNDRESHLSALEAEVERTSPSEAQTREPPTGTVSVPDGETEMIAAIRGDAATAQLQFTDALANVSRFRAALLGSIAACLASHRAVLA